MLILRFFEENFVMIFCLAATWAVASTAFIAWRRSRRDPIFPALDEVVVRFRERFASGVSHRSWFTRLGGARNCLSVTLTDSELWITTFFPFTTMVGSSDLEHRIPTSRVLAVVHRGSRVTIDFATETGDRRRFVLWLRQASEFIAAWPEDVTAE